MRRTRSDITTYATNFRLFFLQSHRRYNRSAVTAVKDKLEPSSSVPVSAAFVHAVRQHDRLAFQPRFKLFTLAITTNAQL